MTISPIPRPAGRGPRARTRRAALCPILDRDPDLRSLAAYNRLRLRGFSAADRTACRRSGARARRGRRDHVAGRAHYGRSALFENVAGDYQGARRLAEQGLALAIETGDLFEHLLCQYSRAWALLHVGEWGEMQRGVGEEIELTERNDHPLWASVYRLQSAWLCTEAFAFGRAEEICEEAVARGKAARHGLSQTLGTILLAVARLGSGQPAAAERALRDLDTRLARDGFAVEWQLRPRLDLARAEIALARGATDEARKHADLVLEVAGNSGDRTYASLGRRVRALAALRAGAPADAAGEIELALEALGADDADAPLAAWRVHATAAEIFEARRRRAQASRHRAASAAVLRRLADSLRGEDELRAELLGAPAVREILARSA